MLICYRTHFCCFSNYVVVPKASCSWNFLAYLHVPFLPWSEQYVISTSGMSTYRNHPHGLSDLCRIWKVAILNRLPTMDELHLQLCLSNCLHKLTYPCYHRRRDLLGKMLRRRQYMLNIAMLVDWTRYWRNQLRESTNLRAMNMFILWFMKTTAWLRANASWSQFRQLKYFQLQVAHKVTNNYL